MERAALILGESGGIRPISAGAVKSIEHENAWYIAIKFGGPGLDEDPPVGVWASAGAIESGAVVSVDALAEEFSGIPKLEAFSVTDEGADAARTCVA